MTEEFRYEPMDMEQDPEQEACKELTLLDMYNALPQALRKRCNSQFAGAAMVLLVASICALYFRHIIYALVGLCFGGIIAWMGIRLLNRCRSGKVVYKQMECIKAHTVPLLKSKTILVLREADVPVGDERGVHQYLIQSSKETGMLTKGTLLNIYVDLDSPTELLAWQIIG